MTTPEEFYAIWKETQTQSVKGVWSLEDLPRLAELLSLLSAVGVQWPDVFKDYLRNNPIVAQGLQSDGLTGQKLYELLTPPSRIVDSAEDASFEGVIFDDPKED